MIFTMNADMPLGLMLAFYCLLHVYPDLFVLLVICLISYLGAV